MVGGLLTLLAFVVTLWQGRKGLGRGAASLACVGYLYGITRANFPDGLTHFTFDAAVLALYLAVLLRPGPSRLARWAEGRTLRGWLQALMLWPFVMLLLSPLLDSQHLLVQLVGLRGAILMVPLVAVGASLEERDLDLLGRTLVWLNLLAVGTALAQVVLGVERFFPRNAMTQIIYASRDVGTSGDYRIPSLFSSAHAFGGTMLLTLPFVLRRWLRGRGFGLARLWTGAAVLGSVLGLFLCGARSPVAQLVLALTVVLLSVRPSAKLLAGLALGTVVVGVVVARTPRLQRFTTLGDTAAVEDRVSASLHTEGFLDVLMNAPLGRGLASSGGTSIPFFLQHLARPQVFLENEYARITMEQGLVGLLLWLAFLAWLLRRPPAQQPGRPVLAERLQWAVSLVLWATAFVGSGTLLSIPGTAFLLVGMGAVLATHAPALPAVSAPRAPPPPVPGRRQPPAPRPRLRRPRVERPA